MGHCEKRCSVWMEEGNLPAFEPLRHNLVADVAVIGGGFTGIVAAYALKRAGLKVVLLERDRCGHGDTGHTTAHLTYVTDTPLTDLAKTFGKDHAGAVWDAGIAAIELIEQAVEREQIDCEWTRVPGFRHAPRGKGQDDSEKDLRAEAELAAEMAFDAHFLKHVPVMETAGVQFANQAKLHPLKYLCGLLKCIPGEGCHVFEKSEVVAFGKEKHSLKVNDYWVHCKFVVIATGVPLLGEKNVVSGSLLQSKLVGYSSYAIGATLPAKLYPQGCFWDTGDPYDYARIDHKRGRDYVIFGGEDHKTGQADDTVARFARLEKRLKEIFPRAEVNHEWSGQVIDTVDGIPLIGEVSEGQFIATGYSGNGITFGAVAAMLACDAVMKRKNPWKDLLNPHRKKLSATWNYLKENADYPYYLVKDRMSRVGKSLDELKGGEGKILQLGGKKLACYRDDAGKVRAVSAACTHLGCIVHWNAAEKTWDCPCHGSRFSTGGEVIAGPAETPLERDKAGEV